MVTIIFTVKIKINNNALAIKYHFKVTSIETWTKLHRGIMVYVYVYFAYNLSILRHLVGDLKLFVGGVVTTADIKNNAWVTVNNDFLVTSGVICQWFSRVTKSRVKIIGKSPHEWPKNRYSPVTNVLFYFLHATLYLEHTVPLQTIIDRSFRYCR